MRPGRAADSPRVRYSERLASWKRSRRRRTIRTWRSPSPARTGGRGIAAGAWFNSSGPASAVASVNPDGTVSLVEGSPDIGGSRAVMAMQVAEVLGIPVETVKPSIVDTDSIGYSSGAGGSGVTFKMGTACHDAAQDIKSQMIERAARIWDVSPDDVQYDKGMLSHRQDPELSITFQALAPRLNGTGGPIVGRATVNPGGVGNAFGLHIVDVEVDPRHRKGNHPALHRHPGRGEGNPSQLCRGPDPGRRGSGHRGGRLTRNTTSTERAGC